MPDDLLLAVVGSRVLETKTLGDGEADRGLGRDPEIEVGRDTGPDRDPFGSRNRGREQLTPIEHPQ